MYIPGESSIHVRKELRVLREIFLPLPPVVSMSAQPLSVSCWEKIKLSWAPLPLQKEEFRVSIDLYTRPRARTR